jgi:hypothetical protein
VAESLFRLPQMIALACHYLIFNTVNAALFSAVTPMLFMRRSSASRDDLLPCAFVSANGMDAVLRFGAETSAGQRLHEFRLGPPTLLDVWSFVRPYPFHLMQAGGGRYVSGVRGNAVVLAGLRRRSSRWR